MWNRNLDTGKWLQHVDTLPKDRYESLKIDLEKVKLYSKCLSGATYLNMNDFGDIYKGLSERNLGFFFGQNYPLRGPSQLITNDNSDEFYNKYLAEDSFTIKNLFTPEKLIRSEGRNFISVDVATTEAIVFTPSSKILIDGIQLVQGHKVLVKDQKKLKTLSIYDDSELYFTDTFPVSSNTLISDNTTSQTYEYYDETNGIYEYDGNSLIRTDLLSDYSKTRKMSVSIKSGNSNFDKQFHLKRLKNGYFPVEGNNIEFEERVNWVLRNRVDYNNIYDLNFYDVLTHGPQKVYDEIQSRTYSIPDRVIAVGEFGAIINNQDQLSIGSTYSISNIISNKFKVNLRSIDEVEKYYWICGDEGTLLKVSKVDFQITKIDLSENLNLVSVSFVNNLYGVVVGKFNRLYYTRDGGFNWVRIKYDEYDKYSYSIVKHITPFIFIVGGENGIFIEFYFSNNIWNPVRRNITKYIGKYDEYEMVEDITDLDYTSTTTIKSFIFSGGLSYSAYLQDGEKTLEIGIETSQFDSYTFSEESYAFISFSFSIATQSVYVNNKFGDETPDFTNFNTYNLYLNNKDQFDSDFPTATLPPDKGTFSLAVPLGPNGTLEKKIYHLDVHLLTNYNFSTDNIGDIDNPKNLSSFYSVYGRYSFKTVDGNMVLISGNNQSLICYDLDKVFSAIDSQFIFASLGTNTVGDIRSIERKKNSNDIYISGDKIYKFPISNFNRFTDRTSNQTSPLNITTVQDIYANKITNSTQSLFLAGNNSVLKKRNLETDSNFRDLDPSFNSRLKSRFLILDYDIGAKLNFFDDNGVYRIPSSVTIKDSDFITTTFSLSSLSGELSWMDYYKDSEKTFKLGSSFQESSTVEFSSVFSYKTNPTNYTITGDKVGIPGTTRNNKYDIFKRDVLGKTYYIIPGMNNYAASEFLYQGDVPPNFSTDYELLLYKNIAVFKRSFQPTTSVENFSLGDVLYLTSDVVDTKMVINRIEYYTYDPGQQNSLIPGTLTQSRPNSFQALERVDIYLYCISNFNENIINNLAKQNVTISVKNLNYYTNATNLVENFNNHPIGMGYKLEKNTGSVTIQGLFNEKTAYYNLQAKISQGNKTYEMKYEDSFINFGYSPTYNIYSYLNRIDPSIFNQNKVFGIMPKLENLLGNGGDSFTNSNVYIDSGSQSNVLIFGSDYKLEWEGLLLNTFVDINAVSTNNFVYNYSQVLITDKYFDPSINGYFIEFNKKLTIGQPIRLFNIESRRFLSQISGDLQLLNNIHRSSTEKYLQNQIRQSSNISFTNYENYIRTKFSTDSYLKVLTSDYDIRRNISAILYTDEEFQISMNILNLESVLNLEMRSPIAVPQGNGIFKLGLSVDDSENKIKVGDLIFVDFYNVPDSEMSGLQTVISASSRFLVTSKDYNFGSPISNGYVKYVSKDPFFNYQPVDIFKQGLDGTVTRSVEILPTNYILTGNTFSLINLDMNKYKLQLLDGLSLEELNQSYHWVLEAEVSNALIGKNENGLVWYSGTWRCGRWFGGTWVSGEWLTGDWYRGTWNAFNVLNKIISAKVDTSYSNPNLSKWYNGRWFEGTWNDGTWYNGRRYAGDWNKGIWYNGVWNNGDWKMGFFYGGIWVNGTWENGIFNCDSKPAYWLDGTFKSGDFENGMWYNGLFGNDLGRQTRFGTKASNSRTATWHGGKWLDGEFHSKMNLNTDGNPIVSEMHKFSIWRTGVWNKGDWYGGIAFNIDFRGGVWHGGILEEIQVIGIDRIEPAQTSTNQIYVNGLFKFNIGDEIWIIDDERNGIFSPLGTNETPRVYRINQVVEYVESESTGLYLNYNLSTLGVNAFYAGKTFSVTPTSDTDLGLRVVSRFSDIYWKSGLWTNGLFIGGQFDSGIWYNGVFEGNWSN